MKLKIFFLLISIYCCSQNNTKGLVYYGHIEDIYAGGRQGPDILSTLVFTNNQSCYTTKKDSLNNLSNAEVKEFYASKSNGAFFAGGIPSNEQGYQVYTDLAKDSVWSSFQRVDYFYVKEKKATLNWELENETKKIGNYTCNKAVCQFRGRTYIAWYTNEIPVSFGPWKLQGLPGLILEAYTPNEEVYIYAKKIEYPTNNPTPIVKIKNSNNSKWLTYNEYLLLTEKLIQNTYNKMILMGVPAENIVKTTPVDEFKEYTE
uniref:GLPGLI family protein n=1 Tax=Flavobacterium sp. TaxID=239 RepID=UPI0040496601